MAQPVLKITAAEWSFNYDRKTASFLHLSQACSGSNSLMNERKKQTASLQEGMKAKFAATEKSHLEEISTEVRTCSQRRTKCCVSMIVLPCCFCSPGCPTHSLYPPVKAFCISKPFRIFRRCCIEGASGRSASKLWLTWNHTH